MTIDQISEALGDIRSDLRHQMTAIEKLGGAVSDVKESLIRGSYRFKGIEDRIETLEQDVAENITPHIDDYRLARKVAGWIGKGLWALFGAGITAGGGFILKIGMAAIGH